jgi:hypothetical protein
MAKHRYIVDVEGFFVDADTEEEAYLKAEAYAEANSLSVQNVEFWETADSCDKCVPVDCPECLEPNCKDNPNG